MALAATETYQGGFVRDSDGRLITTAAGGVEPAPANATTATLSNVASSASNVTILALNANRLGATIFNDVDKVLYLKFGATATTSSYTVQIAAGGYYELPSPVYSGKLDGIWAAGPTGSARVTEITA